MYRCKICGQENKRISSHISRAHKMNVFEYLKEYEDIDCCSLYADGWSAQQISDIIKKEKTGIYPLKKYVLDYLRENKIAIRDTSAATKEWIKKTGGVWNKGKTKEEHPSIMKYAQSRRGTSNPYYTGTDESRAKTRYWENKTEKELKEIRGRSADTLKEKYRSGALVPYIVRNPEWTKELRRKSLEGYKRWQASNDKVRFGNTSAAEREIAEILEECGVKYVRQFSPASKYRYDFYIPETNIVIEYNGTFWHCDPRKYEEDYYNVKKGKTAKEMWEHDKKRVDYLLERGYNVKVIWEEDYKRLTKKEKKGLILEAIKD